MSRTCYAERNWTFEGCPRFTSALRTSSRAMADYLCVIRSVIGLSGKNWCGHLFKAVSGWVGGGESGGRGVREREMESNLPVRNACPPSPSNSPTVLKRSHEMASLHFRSIRELRQRLLTLNHLLPTISSDCPVAAMRLCCAVAISVSPQLSWSPRSICHRLIHRSDCRPRIGCLRRSLIGVPAGVTLSHIALLTSGPGPVLIGSQLDRSGRMRTLCVDFGEIGQSLGRSGLGPPLKPQHTQTSDPRFLPQSNAKHQTPPLMHWRFPP